MTSEVATALAERLDEDARFTAAFEDDPLTTLRDGGFAELAEAVEQDRDRIGELIDRIYRDEEAQGSRRTRWRSSSAGAFPRPR